MPSNLEYSPGEKPEYAFCESVHAAPLAAWHIRRVGEAGLKLGGGIDTPSLCGRLRPFGDHVGERVGTGGGYWRGRILPRHLEAAPKGERPICCPECAAEYKKATHVQT